MKGIYMTFSLTLRDHPEFLFKSIDQVHSLNQKEVMGEVGLDEKGLLTLNRWTQRSFPRASRCALL